MRGFFGRNRADKPQPGVVIHSYEDACYPPRSYRYQVQQSAAYQVASGGVAVTPIILPSIDADSICEPRMRPQAPPGPHGSGARVGLAGDAHHSSHHPQQQQQQGGIEFEKRPPPHLREFFSCFAPDTFGGENAAFSTALAHSEPLNVFHYPELFLAGTSSRGVSDSGEGVPAATQQQQHHARTRTMAAVAEAAGVPAELRSFLWTSPVVMSSSTGGKDDNIARAAGTAAVVSHLAKLRVRPAIRPRPPRPIRRGAKVTLVPVAGNADGSSAAGIGRSPRRGGVKRERGGDGEGGEDAEGAEADADEEDDVSVGFHAEDDDDGNVDDDDDGGSGGDDGDCF